MFDMGPYYLTALVNLLGPVRRVTGSTRDHLPAAHHHQPAQARQGDQGGDAHPRRRRDGLRQRRRRHDHHQLRRLGGQPAAHRDLRHRRLAQRPDPNSFGGVGAGPARRRAGVERGAADATATPRTAAASAWPTWPMRCLPAGRTAPAASWPTTCSTSCTPSTTPRHAGKHIAITSTVPQPAALAVRAAARDTGRMTKRRRTTTAVNL